MITRKKLSEKLESIAHDLASLTDKKQQKKDETREETEARFDRFHKACGYFIDWDASYHDRETILQTLQSAVDDYGKPEDVIDEDDIQDDLWECADSATPIYYHDTTKWFADGNWTAVNEYVDEMGSPDKLDIMAMISGAYCYTLQNEMRSLLSKVMEELKDSEDDV